MLSRTPRRDATPAALPVIHHESQVLRIPEWAVLANISLRSARRLIASGEGPKVVRISSRLIGVTLASHKAWVAAREHVS
jgi:predicted DNA-binding transcriptional regulator AlpA